MVLHRNNVEPSRLVLLHVVFAKGQPPSVPGRGGDPHQWLSGQQAPWGPAQAMPRCRLQHLSSQMGSPVSPILPHSRPFPLGNVARKLSRRDEESVCWGGGHTMPHPAQSQHANYWAPRTRKRHQQEHRPQRPTESSNPTQHAKGRTGDRPGPHKGATTRRNVTQGVQSTPCQQCLDVSRCMFTCPNGILKRRRVVSSVRHLVSPTVIRDSYHTHAPCTSPRTQAGK